jgi:hypothetical protein
MKKRLFMFFCGIIICATILNAQSTQRHWISASPGLRVGGSSFVWPAAELRYELMINSLFSIGAYVYYEHSYGIGITGRWYPSSKSFFLELGSGYNKFYANNIYFDDNTRQWVDYIENYNGIDIIPGLGWRIDVGKPGGFYIAPSVKFPIIFRWYKNPHAPDPRIGSTLIGYFSFGYAF